MGTNGATSSIEVLELVLGVIPIILMSMLLFDFGTGFEIIAVGKGEGCGERSNSGGCID